MTVGESAPLGGLSARGEFPGVRQATPGTLLAHNTYATGRTGPVPVIAASIALLPLIKPAGPGNASPVDVVIVAALLASVGWAVTQRPRLRLPFVAAMSLYIGAGALAALLGPLPGNGALTIVQEIALLAWALAIANTLRGPADVALVLRTWVWAAVASAMLMIAGYVMGIDVLAGRTPEFGDRAALTFADPNMAGTYFAVAVMLVWATRIPGRLWLRLAAYAVLLTALALAGSNGSFLALGVSIAVAVIIRTAHRSGALAAIALASGGLFAVTAGVVVSDLGSIQERAGDSGRTGELTLGRSDQSIEGRQLLKQLGLELYGEGDLIGSGPNTASWLLQQRQAPVSTELHDDYLATLVERGLIGAAGLLLLIGSVTWRARALFTPSGMITPGRFTRAGHGLQSAPGSGEPARRDHSEEWGAVLARPWAVAGALAGFAVAALFYEVLHFRHLWALFAVIAAIHLWREP